MTNQLFYGDNLDVLKDNIRDESIDLVYLDPPFNSNATYNVLFKQHDGEGAAAQIQAFDDTWTWTQQTETLYEQLLDGKTPFKTADALSGIYKLLGKSDMSAYLVMMTARFTELYRVLKPTGSMFTHCDPTASHYLKIILDSMFGPERFANEIIWRRTGSHTTPKRFETIHDVILFYKKTNNAYFKPGKRPYTKKHVKERYIETEDGYKFNTGGNILSGPGITQGESGQPWRGFNPSAKGRHWAIPGYLAEQMPPEFENLGTLAKLDALHAAGLIESKPNAEWPHPVKYLSEDDGQFYPDIWAYQSGTEGVLYGTEQGIDADVQWLGPKDPERLGYPTQKPEGLLARIINTACPPDGIVLDPFCGCGTTIDAAQSLQRQWIGIDITYLAIDLIERRLEQAYGPQIKDTYTLNGTPRDLQSAKALFTKNPFDFERWAVTLVDGQPNDKQVNDKGRDGIIRFHLDKKNTQGTAIVSVKGGATVNPAMVRELAGTVDNHRAEMGILITMEKITKGMKDAADTSGTYTHPLSGTTYPKVQIITAAELLNGKTPNMPTPILPYKLAKTRSGQAAMF